MGFQFKPELAAKILAGEKTQTRCPVKDGEYMGRCYTEALDVSRDTAYYNAVFTSNTHLKWLEDRTYAIQPGRGKKGIGFLKVTAIRSQDVRNISLEDAIAEGFESQLDFLAVWIGFYDKGIWLDRVDIPVRNMQVGDWYMHCTERGHKWHRDSATEPFIWDVIESRPDSLYQAWAISFELVKSAEAVQS